MASKRTRDVHKDVAKITNLNNLPAWLQPRVFLADINKDSVRNRTAHPAPTPEKHNRRVSFKVKEEVRPIPSRNNMHEFQLALLQCLDDIEKQDAHQLFSTTNKSPKKRRLDYADPQQTDFAILRSRVKNNHYEDFKMFETDFKLMCYNVMRFNKPESLNYAAADELLRYGFRCIGLTAEKHKSQFRPTESSAAVYEQSGFPQSDLEYDKRQRLYAAIMNNNPIVPLRDVLDNRGGAATENGFDLPGSSGVRAPRSCTLKNRDSTKLSSVLNTLLEEFERKDVEQVFSFPVTDDIAPGYSQVIRKPMDLSTMRAKMEAGKYSSFHRFRTDFELMCENAMRYNHVDTVHYKTAKKFLPMGLKLIAKHTPEVEYHAPVTNGGLDESESEAEGSSSSSCVTDFTESESVGSDPYEFKPEKEKRRRKRKPSFSSSANQVKRKKNVEKTTLSPEEMFQQMENLQGIIQECLDKQLKHKSRKGHKGKQKEEQ